MTRKPIPAAAPVHRTNKFSFREAWTWPPDIDRWFERETSDLVDPCPRPILHVCSGSSRLGDITLDLVHPNAMVHADFRHLPFADASIGTVICDPPYEIEPFTRVQLGKEIRRVVRPGGRLLWCAPWLPMEGNWTFDRLIVASARTGLPRNARLLLKATRRVPGPKAGIGQLNAAERAARVVQRIEKPLEAA